MEEIILAIFIETIINTLARHLKLDSLGKRKKELTSRPKDLCHLAHRRRRRRHDSPQIQQIQIPEKIISDYSYFKFYKTLTIIKRKV